MEQRLMAFWKYDQYPFVLWAEITKFLKNGRVEVVGHDGYYPLPVLILPFDEGEKLAFVLKALKGNRVVDISKIENSYLVRIEDAISQYKTFKVE